MILDLMRDKGENPMRGGGGNEGDGLKLYTKATS